MKNRKTATAVRLMCAALCVCCMVGSDVAGLDFSGQKSEKEGIYTIEKNFVITPDKTEEEFNRYTFSYSSTQPLSGVITYTDGSVTGSEEFFLAAGENTSFSSLIDGYAEGKTQKTVTKITLSTIKDVSAEFTFSGLKTEKVAVLKDKTVYIQTDKYKVGINLLWGGGISYIEDKEDGDASITNLLNNHDTGRLVQQSYYGTGSAPYVAGDYNGTPWPYNPVQGGDLRGNSSKLVDFTVSDELIYVKSRPLDWGKNGSQTPSYMENIYKIDGDVISVYNSFTDFSGYDNPKTTQELPAFYTISYLNNFYCYDGVSPWTDGALTKYDSLGFWGENKGVHVEYQSENTETWTAWVDDADWGIGLYVPNVTSALAGRYSYNGSKSPSNGATNYVAPLRYMILKFAEKIEYSYLITTGSVSDIRACFKERSDFADNSSLSQKVNADFSLTDIRFDTDDALSFFSTKNECTVSISDGLLKFTAKELKVNDPYANFDFAASEQTVPAADYPYVVITYMVPETNSAASYTSECFFGSGEQKSAEGGKSKTYTVKADGKFHAQVIDLSGALYWKEKVNFIRFDFFSGCEEDDAMYLYSVRMAKTKEEAQSLAASEAAAAETRYSGEQTTKPDTTEIPETSAQPETTFETEITSEPESTAAPESAAPGTAGTDTVERGTDETDAQTEEPSRGVKPYVIIPIIAAAVAAAAAVAVIIMKKRKH